MLMICIDFFTLNNCLPSFLKLVFMCGAFVFFLGAWSSLPIVEGGLFGPFARDVENEKDAKAYTWEVSSMKL